MTQTHLLDVLGFSGYEGLDLQEHLRISYKK